MGQKSSLITEKRQQMATTLPAAVCIWLQLLPTYFDVTLYIDISIFTWLSGLLSVCL